jgi:peptidoglycan/LPS O-acetylase OafA/YrhL
MTSSAMKKYDFIDALRGYAILFVIASHVQRMIEVHTGMGRQQSLPGWLHLMTENLSTGVQLFFLISALTLCLSASKRITEHNPTINFAIRRFFRIAPLFYAAFIFFVVLPVIRGNLQPTPEIDHMLATLLFVNGWWPTWISSPIPAGWSVAVEMWTAPGLEDKTGL